MLYQYNSISIHICTFSRKRFSGHQESETAMAPRIIQKQSQSNIAAIALFVFAILTTAGVTDGYANTETTSPTGQSEMPVLLVQNDWTSQLVLTQIVGNLLEESDISIELVPFDSQLQFQAIADGHVHFQIAVWEGPMYDAFSEAKKSGLVDAGTHTATTREGWWIPDYVLDDCPDATNWQGLNDCAYLFATDETKFDGRFVGPPLDWAKDYARQVAALRMNFHVHNVGAIEELWSELRHAYQQRVPVVLFNWTPNFTDVEYDGRFVDFPEPVKECESDATWGSNPDAPGDCGDRYNFWLKKAAWEGLAQLNPAAWAILQRVNFTNTQIARAIQLVDIEGLSPADAALKWTEEHPQLINQWLGR